MLLPLPKVKGNLFEEIPCAKLHWHLLNLFFYKYVQRGHDSVMYETQSSGSAHKLSGYPNVPISYSITILLYQLSLMNLLVNEDTIGYVITYKGAASEAVAVEDTAGK